MQKNLPTYSNSITTNVLIIGAGQAGCELAFNLRLRGYTGEITLLSNEDYLPYRRPPLSKAFLLGEVNAETLFIKQLAAFEKQQINYISNCYVNKIDRQLKTVSLNNGQQFNYEYLVLATGGSARQWESPNVDYSPKIHYLRHLNDSIQLQSELIAGNTLVIIGGGYIGLEVAAAAVEKGLNVYVIEREKMLLARVAPPNLSDFYLNLHQSKGALCYLNTQITNIQAADNNRHLITLNNGETIIGDSILAGIGLVPNIDLAQHCGLEINQGIVVNSQCRSSDHSIFAIGDCSFHHNTFYQRSMRVESVSNAMDQARLVAHIINEETQGNSTELLQYAVVPWFWSDQYHIKMQMVGLISTHLECICRGDITSESFILFYIEKIASTSLIIHAAIVINRAADFAQSKRLVNDNVLVTAEQLMDETIPLRTLV